jgi:hypothetical protein
MARVLVYTAPGSGHAYPPVATAIALHDRGHDVSVRTESGSVEAIGRLGLAAAPIDPRIEAIPLEDWKTRTSIGALVSACDTFAKRARYEVPYLQAVIEAERPESSLRHFGIGGSFPWCLRRCGDVPAHDQARGRQCTDGRENAPDRPDDREIGRRVFGEAAMG